MYSRRHFCIDIIIVLFQDISDDKDNVPRSESPGTGIKDLKRQCRGLGMAGMLP